MKNVFLFAFCILALTGCNATYRDGNQNIHVNDGSGNGNFCPPGQAKKGNC